MRQAISRGHTVAAVLAACMAVCLLVLFGTSMRVHAAPAAGHNVADFYNALQTVRDVEILAEPESGARSLGTLHRDGVIVGCGITDNGYFQVVFNSTSFGYILGGTMKVLPTTDEQKAAFVNQAQIVLRNSGASLAAAQQAAAEQQLAAQQAAAAQQLAAQQAAAQAAAEQQLAAQQAAAAQQLAAQQAAAEQQLAAQQAAAAAAAARAQQLAAAQQAAAQSGGNVIFVGDSRTGQMYNAVGQYPNIAFIYIYGGRLEHFTSEEEQAKIDSYITPGSIVVINYGVNDLEHGWGYSQAINRCASKWAAKGAVTYYATVGPMYGHIWEKDNDIIDSFNAYVNGQLSGGVGRIDLNSYLKQTGYGMIDELHYTAETYQRMFIFLMQSIGRL